MGVHFAATGSFCSQWFIDASREGFTTEVTEGTEKYRPQRREGAKGNGGRWVGVVWHDDDRKVTGSGLSAVGEIFGVLSKVTAGLEGDRSMVGCRVGWRGLVFESSAEWDVWLRKCAA
jgi:hypothetical protein